ncbi:MAG: threonine/serine dehydratase, partial [Pseudomonadota bacterium]
LLSNPTLDAMTGANVLLKPECLQRTGSFKFRGACNRLGALSEEERRAGVVAYSSGNHAQGVAAAAQHYGVHATIVMPADAPAIKIERTRGYGAEVILYDRYTESREAIGEALAQETGAVLVRPYDDPFIIAGQGTAGLELAQQAAAQGAELDAVLVCCGGGGLTAGIAVALAAESPKTQLYAVEPEGFDDHARSLASGRIEQNDPSARSICDALLAPEPGELTFSINRRALAGGLVVSDEEARAAMRFAFEQLKLVLEPGGAVALAAVLSGKLDVAGKTVGVVLSGGNVAPDFFVEVLTRDS